MKGKKKMAEKTITLTAREKKILAVVKENTEGIILPEIAYIMGIAFLSIIQDVKRLLKKGLIKKKENKYFPN